MAEDKMGAYDDREEAGAEEQVHPRNKLNDLSARDWLKFTKSWFVCNPPPRSRNQVQHPAKFPEGMVKPFIEFFTKKGEMVLDPFAGVGSALVAAAQAGRRGIGIELSPEFCALAREHLAEENLQQIIIQGDAARGVELCRQEGVTGVDFVITSPPYWNMLGTTRGNVLSAQQQREQKGLRTDYGEDPRDLGQISGYADFLAALTAIFAQLRVLLKRDRFLVVVIQNVRDSTGEVRPLAWDLARDLGRYYTFKGERLWLQDNKPLGIWGYPSEFVSNVHHHYCLVFKNDRVKSDTGQP